MDRFVKEESLSGVGLSTHPGRYHAVMMKKFNRDIPNHSPKCLPPPPQKTGSSPKKKKRIADVIEVPSICKEPFSIAPPSDHLPKICIPEDVLEHSCTGLQHAEELILNKQELDLNLITVLNNWNTEFVKVKFLQEDYKKKYADKAKEVSSLETQLAECRTEMANLATSYSLQRQEVDRAREELVEAKTEASYTTKDLQTHISKISDLELQVKDLQARLSEKDVALSRAEAGAGKKAIKEFKSLTAFKSIIQEHVQKAIDHVYEVEVKGLELQSMEEGFTRGFLKGTRLVYHRTGAAFEDLSPSQASQDPSPDDEEDTESSSSSSDRTITSI